MNVEHKSIRVVGVGGHGLSDGACSWIVSAPFLVNTAPVKAGEELLWRRLGESRKKQ